MTTIPNTKDAIPLDRKLKEFGGMLLDDETVGHNTLLLASAKEKVVKVWS
jgi:hypothetical protein